MNKLCVAGLSLLSIFATSSTRQIQQQQRHYDSESYKPVYENPIVEILPKQVEQGKTAFINIKTKHYLEKPYYLFKGKAFPIFKEKNKHINEYMIYTGLFPTTPDYEEGSYQVIVSDSVKNPFIKFSDTLEIEIKKGNFAAQNLSLSSHDRVLSTKEKTLKEAERDFVINALNSVSYTDYYEDPPYDLPTKGIMTTEYGAIRSYYHNGIDISAPIGQPIKSILGGKVLCARQQKYTGNGGIVIIDHGRFKSVYLHMSRFNVKEGDTIQKGQIIGKVGNTGRSTGPHLHFGIYPNGIPVDPEQWLVTLEKDKKVVNRLEKQVKNKIFTETQKQSVSIKDTAKSVFNNKAKSSLKRTFSLIRK